MLQINHLITLRETCSTVYRWSTHWFRVSFDLTPEFLSSIKDAADELLFNWNSSGEATIWDEETKCPVGAFSCGGAHGDVRAYYPVSVAPETSKLEYLLEVTCNTVIGEGSPMFISPPNEKKVCELKSCQLVVRDRRVYRVIRDLTILRDIAKVRVCVLINIYKKIYAEFTLLINVCEKLYGSVYC